MQFKIHTIPFGQYRVGVDGHYHQEVNSGQIMDCTKN